MAFTVAIVGRPNVGKSTLFNRLVGKRLALVAETPGVTRDRREGLAYIGDLPFSVIDTAGLEEAPGESLEARMREQTEKALADADLALLLIDARAGVTPADAHFADWLRGKDKPVILVANKCESAAGDAGFYEAFALGLGEPIALSAEHGHGIGELLSALAPHAEAAIALQEEDAETDGSGLLRLAIIGRPNTGKSTLVNRLIGEERLLTGPEAGITRDAIAVDWSYRGRALRLFDTAGLRRRSRVADKLEVLSVADTRRAIRFANVAVLMLDASVMLEKQDLTIARQVVDEGRALVIAANKWDAVKDRKGASRKLRDRLQTSLPQVRGVPVVTISALEGTSLDTLMDAVFAVYDIWNSRVSTGRLNQWLDAMTEAHPPPLAGSGRRVRLRYATQVKSRPPTFAVWTSRPEDLPDSYRRYLVNGLREDFGLSGIPIRLQFRKGRNPYAPRRKRA
jgi:GTP-binding protein